MPRRGRRGRRRSRTPRRARCGTAARRARAWSPCPASPPRSADAVLAQRDHVHVALDHDRAASFAVRLLHLPQREQLAALVEQRGLGRVEVFRRLLRFKHAPAERDHAAAAIEDREHQPVAEAVVLAAALVAWTTMPASFEQFHAARRRCPSALSHAVVAVRRAAEPEALDGRRVEPALPAKYALRLVAARQLLGRTARRASSSAYRSVLSSRGAASRPPSRGTFRPTRLRQFLDRVEELQPVVVHQELDRAAVRAAAEAVDRTAWSG